MLPFLDTAPGIDTAIVITWGTLALLGIIGFIGGLFMTISLMLLKRTYGIMVKVIREVGVTYKEVYNKKIKATNTTFRFRNRMYQVDLSRTAWMDWSNRPVVIYELDTVSPIIIDNTNSKLQQALKKMKAIQPMRIIRSKNASRPSEPFDLLFGRKAMEAILRATRGKTSPTGLIGIAIVCIILGLLAGYLLGNYLPLPLPGGHVATQFTNSTTSTFSHTTVTLP